MIKNIFYKKNIGCGYLYFYIHLITEIASFYFLSTIFKNQYSIWLIPLIYDALAFVPQSIIGYLNDLHPKINLSLIGIILLTISLILKKLSIPIFIPLIILCLGNAFVHIRGAQITIKNSNGLLSHSAIFVSGGSIGVIIGKILGKASISYLFIIFLIITTIPFILLAEEYNNSKKTITCNKFNYINKKVNPYIIIILAIIVVIIRGYIGYGIPTSWNKTTKEAILFYLTMCIGKAFGGILADKIGLKKVILLSTIISIPFLCFGNNKILISLIGIMLFSMTMSITLAILISTLKNKPGLAFGLTTIGLFLGTLPIFFIKITNTYINIIFIITSGVLCYLILNYITGKVK